MVARAKEEGPGTDDKQEGETSTKVHPRFPLREEAVKLKKRTRWTETQEGAHGLQSNTQAQVLHS